MKNLKQLVSQLIKPENEPEVTAYLTGLGYALKNLNENNKLQTELTPLVATGSTMEAAKDKQYRYGDVFFKDLPFEELL